MIIRVIHVVCFNVLEIPDYLLCDALDFRRSILVLLVTYRDMDFVGWVIVHRVSMFWYFVRDLTADGYGCFMHPAASNVP